MTKIMINKPLRAYNTAGELILFILPDRKVIWIALFLCRGRFPVGPAVRPSFLALFQKWGEDGFLAVHVHFLGFLLRPLELCDSVGHVVKQRMIHFLIIRHVTSAPFPRLFPDPVP